MLRSAFRLRNERRTADRNGPGDSFGVGTEYAGMGPRPGVVTGRVRSVMAVLGVGLASIDRTAYPRFKRVVFAQERAEAFTPTLDECAWAREKTQSDPHLLAPGSRAESGHTYSVVSQ